MSKTQGFGSHPENIAGKGSTAPAWSWASLLRETVEEPDSTYPELTKKIVIAKKLSQLAAKGDISAIKELMNRMDGMPKQPVELDSKEDQIKQVKKLIEDEVQTLGETLPQESNGGTVPAVTEPGENV